MLDTVEGFMSRWVRVVIEGDTRDPCARIVSVLTLVWIHKPTNMIKLYGLNCKETKQRLLIAVMWWEQMQYTKTASAVKLKRLCH